MAVNAAPSACWDRSGCLLPQGKQETLREGTRTRRDHQRVPAGHAPCPENFPIRNCIVAGLPLGVVVVKGTQYSGSLITARLTMEFAREVFGCTGQCDPTLSASPPTSWIQQGAKLVTNGENVIEELQLRSVPPGSRPSRPKPNSATCSLPRRLTPAKRRPTISLGRRAQSH
jgi:predicted Rossmann fold nucleotide-binding protein DprA/Smf involved in DNA uptake